MTSLPRSVFWRRALVVVHDAAWIPLAIALAYWARFNLGTIPADLYAPMGLMMAVAIPVHGLAFWFFGCYRGVWRFASLPDLFRLSKAVAVATLFTLTGLFLLNRLDGIPRSVSFLYPLFLLFGTGGSRAAYRLGKELWVRGLHRPGVQRVMVVGAGNGGEHLVRGLRTHPETIPVGIVDDDPHKWGTEIYGVRVLGPTSQLAALVQRYHADMIILAIPSAPHHVFSRVLAQATEANVPCQVSSSLSDNGEQGVSGLRPVTTEDVLGREPVHLDEGAITATLKGRTVLVTGGGGSIGLELCRRVLAHEPERLIVLDSSEYNLYRAEQTLRPNRSPARTHFMLGDVCDRGRMRALFEKHHPDVVFHAAAYKHVPLLESNVLAAVRNNIIGTRVVAETAAEFGSGKFVLVSTDKTVNPTNVMGATKRVAELICRHLQQRHADTDFLITRFGNVLGSAGSVIPLFERQIREGGPVTITHPEVKRFFMTVEEATGLIIQATALSQGGEVFVLEMGKPILIRELAENMIRLSGLVPGKDIKLIYTGLRAGEKLEEELFYDTETLRGTGHSKLMLAECGAPVSDTILERVDTLEAAFTEGREKRVIAQLKDIVPAFERFVPAESTGDYTPLRVVK